MKTPPSPFPDHAYPADPYPGARPPFSYVETGGFGYEIRHDEHSPSRWRLVDGDEMTDLDQWLADQGAAPLRERLPVLAYGSNSNPEKIAWLRHELGLQGPAIVLRADCTGIAAVWSAGFRARDGQRPAVLAAAPGTETHTVWLATPDQRRVLDECEGRGERYRLSWVNTTIRLDDRTLDRVLAYTARPDVIGRDVPQHLNRSPLVARNGQLVRVIDIGQSLAARLDGDPATTDGLNCEEVIGEPDTPGDGDTIDQQAGQDRP